MTSETKGILMAGAILVVTALFIHFPVLRMIFGIGLGLTVSWHIFRDLKEHEHDLHR